MRSGIGALAGATLAGVALRTRRLARRRGVSMLEVVSEMPEVLAQDAQHIARSARAAFDDGRIAAQRKEAEIDKVLTQPRQTEGAS